MTEIPKPTQARNQFISFARAFSIITIVLFHFLRDLPFSNTLQKLVSLGGGGVHLFIFASGFGLFLSNYSNFKQFIEKRFSKVIIPYYFAITIIFLLNLFLKLYAHGWQAYLSHIFFYKMFIEQYEASFGGQFWFISTIIQFYLVFPLLLHIVKKYTSLTCLVVSLLISLSYALTISSLGYGDMRTVNSFFLQYLWEFILGMVVAKEKLIDKITGLKWYYSLAMSIIAYAIMGVLVLKFGTFGKNVNDVFSFIGYMSMSVSVFTVVSFSKKLVALVLSIDPISYALFLVHYFVYNASSKFIFHGATLLDVPVIFLMSLIVAAGFNMLLSKVTQQKNR